MTISPLTAVSEAGNHEVAVHDPDVDHRVTTDPQHEQLARAGEVFPGGGTTLRVL
jgi:hypothetical protein